MVSFISHIGTTTGSPSSRSGLCRVKSRSPPSFRGKAHTARHNPVPGIIPFMPGAA